jgi:glycosyltransferase involved in cell wall biosynthesis
LNDTIERIDPRTADRAVNVNWRPRLNDTIQLTIVIPVYNEGENIGPTLDQLERVVRIPHEVLIVYDFDGDTTLPAVRPRLDDHPHWRLVKNEVARGPSGALRTGFRHARGAHVLVAMADLCDDLTQIDQLLRLAHAGADVVCPSRYCEGGRQHFKGSAVKLWAPRAAGWLLRLLAGLPTSDATNSFKLYSKRLLDDLRLTSTVSFSVTIEIVAKAHCLGYRIVEVPTTWLDRQFGKSNFKVGRSLVTYFPWFCLMMLRGRLVRVPASWFRAWLSVGGRGAAADAAVDAVPARPTAPQELPLSYAGDPRR